MASAFVAEFSRRLQGQSPALALPLTWIEQRLSQNSLTIDQLVQSENQQQAADQVSIGNSIGSLRLLGASNWRNFVEDMSAVELVFRAESQRHSRENGLHHARPLPPVSRRSPSASSLSESDVARIAVRLRRAKRRRVRRRSDRARRHAASTLSTTACHTRKSGRAAANPWPRAAPAAPGASRSLYGGGSCQHRPLRRQSWWPCSMPSDTPRTGCWPPPPRWQFS